MEVANQNMATIGARPVVPFCMRSPVLVHLQPSACMSMTLRRVYSLVLHTLPGPDFCGVLHYCTATSFYRPLVAHTQLQQGTVNSGCDGSLAWQAASCVDLVWDQAQLNGCRRKTNTEGNRTLGSRGRLRDDPKKARWCDRFRFIFERSAKSEIPGKNSEKYIHRWSLGERGGAFIS